LAHLKQPALIKLNREISVMTIDMNIHNPHNKMDVKKMINSKQTRTLLENVCNEKEA